MVGLSVGQGRVPPAPPPRRPRLPLADAQAPLPLLLPLTGAWQRCSLLMKDFAANEGLANEG